MALHGQLEDLHSHIPLTSTPLPFRPRLREVPSLHSWMYCFAAYVAVRSDDPLTRDLLAYYRLMIREALRHGGNGWQEYDRSFRRQPAINGTLRWNVLSPGLQASTLVGTGSGVFCTLCRELNHSAPQCALAPVQQQVLQEVSPFPPSGLVSRRVPHLANPLTAPRRMFRPSRRPETALQICASWNRGSCSFSGTCSYRHACGYCQLGHRGKECLTAPEGSVYHRLRMARAPTTPLPTAASAPPRRDNR